MQVDVLKNISDLIEELDREYPSVLLVKLSGVYAWRIISSRDRHPVGILSVKLMGDGCCAKVIVCSTGGVVSFPEMSTVVDTMMLSDEEERGKLTDLFLKLRGIAVEL